MATPLTSAELGVMKDLVVPLAFEVGRWARRQQVDHHAGRTDFGVSIKTSPGDVVTLIDLEAQKRIAQALKQAYPTFGLLGEEGLSEFDAKAPVWVIDPIDGTRAFISGLPLWGTLVGLKRNGRAVA
ncbi:MAG TPA: inositol monophosphatase family protein, partial [Trueperaceae bacterium]|nr:inositol monophosphatase family protein [Trueperaceae bacterium]